MELGSSREYYAIIPSDAVEVSNIGRGVYVGTGGDISVKNYLGETINFKNVQDGTWLPIVVYKILETGTTATDIIILP